MKVDGVEVKVINLENFTEEEAKNYVDYVRERISDPLKSIEVKMCDDGKIDLDYTTQGEKFERIRRITGYLTGDLNSWNNAKRAEESERVKHNIFA
ncbi:MAG: hypothetical protein IK062_03630 [Selenomonadaceae bacterium]|nr:hypothetical protein [Selenomonadaceae bacterium]